MRTVRATALFLVALTGALVALVVLAFDGAARRYSAGFSRRLGPLVRRLIPWGRPAEIISPVLPIVALGSVGLVERGGLPVAAVVLAVVALAEVYGVTLRRGVWVPEFEPEFMLSDRPFGRAPRTFDHLRIQNQFRTIAAHAVVLLVCVIGATIAGSAGLLVALVPFGLKYFGFSAALGEFEVAAHWNLHVDVLELPGAPLRTRAVRMLLEYVVGPLHGYVPRVYRANHIYIHHRNDANEDDPHSPLPYNRRSFLEFGHFALRMTSYLLLGWDTLRSSAPVRIRLRLAATIVVFWIAVVGLAMVVPGLALWIGAACLYRGVTATRSQYVWHGLAEPDAESDPMRSTTLWVPSRTSWSTLVATGLGGGNSARPALRSAEPAAVPDVGGHWAFYDNLHLVHHLWPGADPGALPQLLEYAAGEMQRRDIAVLELQALPDFAVNCWSDRIDRIAPHLATRDSVTEARACLERRLRPSSTSRSAVAAASESTAGRAADRFFGWCLPLATMSSP